MPAVDDRLPREMTARLANVRHRIRGVELALAAERALLAVIAAVVLSFLLDTALEPEVVVRRPFTIFLLASALLAGGGFVALAFKRRLTDDTVAVLIEQVYPELEDGLVSSVQLARDLERGGQSHTSPALIRSVIARTEKKARGLDFGRVVDPSPLLPATFLTLAAVFVIGILSFQSATKPLVVAWFERCILGKDVSYPKAVALEVTVPGEHDGTLAVARGDDVPVEIVITRGRSKVERLVVRTWQLKKSDSGHLSRKGRAEETRLQQVGPETDAKYRKIYQNVTEAFEFEVYAGNNVRSGTHRVVVVDRPRVEEARFWLTYPEYVGMPPTPDDKPETQPDLRVPVGTDIRYEVVANKALESAKLVFETDDPQAKPVAPGQPAPVKTEYGDDPQVGGKDKLDRRVLAGKFRVMKTVHFRYELHSKDGYADGPKPVLFGVTAVIDRPPEVRFIVPGRPKQVTPRAIVPVEIEFKDDYGLVRSELRLRIDLGGSPGKDEKSEPLKFPPDATRAANVKWRWDISEYGLHPNDKVIYYAAAWDNNVLVPEEKRLGQSAKYELSVVSPEDLARILQDRLAHLRDELLAAAKGQHQAHDDTDALVKTLVLKTKLEDEDKRKLLLADYDQRKVTSKLVSVYQELDRLVEERELNRLGDNQELDFQKDIRDKVKELGEATSPLISREFDDARHAPDLDEKTKAKIGQIPDLQNDLEKTIVAIAESILKRATFSDVIREMRDLMGAHDRAVEGTKTELKHKNPNEKAPNEK
jgi:hypothetical protein